MQDPRASVFRREIGQDFTRLARDRWHATVCERLCKADKALKAVNVVSAACKPFSCWLFSLGFSTFRAGEPASQPLFSVETASGRDLLGTSRHCSARGAEADFSTSTAAPADPAGIRV